MHVLRPRIAVSCAYVFGLAQPPLPLSGGRRCSPDIPAAIKSSPLRAVVITSRLSHSHRGRPRHFRDKGSYVLRRGPSRDLTASIDFSTERTCPFRLARFIIVLVVTRQTVEQLVKAATRDQDAPTDPDRRDLAAPRCFVRGVSTETQESCCFLDGVRKAIRWL